MQYPIPQFIEEEGKIIFFMTFRQFFMLAGGGAVCLVIYFLAPFWVFTVSTVFIMGIIGLLAFLRINNMSAVKVGLNFLGFTMGGKSYIWKKKSASYPLKIEKTPTLTNQQTPDMKIQKGRLKETKKIVELTKR